MLTVLMIVMPEVLLVEQGLRRVSSSAHASACQGRVKITCEQTKIERSRVGIVVMSTAVVREGVRTASLNIIAPHDMTRRASRREVCRQHMSEGEGERVEDGRSG